MSIYLGPSGYLLLGRSGYLAVSEACCCGGSGSGGSDGSEGSGSGVEGVDTLCCPDRNLPETLYSCFTSAECATLDGQAPLLEVRGDGTDEWVTSRFILCEFNPDDGSGKEVELEVTCAGDAIWRAELHFYDLVNPAFDFTVLGTLISAECDPLRLEFEFSVATNPCCGPSGSGTITVVITETDEGCP